MKNKYDVIIIGAGIGGLVSGCYLAKSGLSVIILEKLDKPGGYCSSFQKNGFLFDAGPHSFGSCRSSGQVGRILNDLELTDKIKLKKKKISNIIITPDYRVHFNDNPAETLQHLQTLFPSEKKNIKLFFNLILDKNIALVHSKLTGKTFQQVLDIYFKNYKLKSILGMLVGNLGLSSSYVAAFTAVILYREHIFDGGYYPEGGMQTFSNSLANAFKQYGGCILLSCEAEEIMVKHNHTYRVITRCGKSLRSDYIISNCDAFHTYSKLLKNRINSSFVKKLNNFTTSLSFFAVHLGFKNPIRNELFKCSTLWHFSQYDTEKIYESTKKGKIFPLYKYMVFGFPYSKARDDETNALTLYILAHYKDAKTWDKHRKNLAQNLLNHATKILPIISKRIDNVCITTPYDFFKYTYNKNGSISGWASTPTQIDSNLVGISGYFPNLLHVGHWVTSPGGQGGIPMVAYTGRTAAKYLQRLMK